MKRIRTAKNRITLIICALIICNVSSIFANTFNCWSCHRSFERTETVNCSVCGWDICPHCGACKVGCFHSRAKAQSQDGSELPDYYGYIFWAMFVAGITIAVTNKKQKSKVISASNETEIDVDAMVCKKKSAPKVSLAKEKRIEKVEEKGVAFSQENDLALRLWVQANLKLGQTVKYRMEGSGTILAIEKDSVVIKLKRNEKILRLAISDELKEILEL